MAALRSFASVDRFQAEIASPNLKPGYVLVGDELFLLERDKNVMARLAADDSSDVAAAGCILRQHHITWSKAADRAIAGFDFHLTGKSDDVLPFGHGMIIT